MVPRVQCIQTAGQALSKRRVIYNLLKYTCGQGHKRIRYPSSDHLFIYIYLFCRGFHGNKAPSKMGETCVHMLLVPYSATKQEEAFPALPLVWPNHVISHHNCIFSNSPLFPSRWGAVRKWEPRGNKNHILYLFLIYITAVYKLLANETDQAPGFNPRDTSAHVAAQWVALLPLFLGFYILPLRGFPPVAQRHLIMLISAPKYPIECDCTCPVMGSVLGLVLDVTPHDRHQN